MPTVKMILACGACVLTILSAMSMLPLWTAVGVLCVLALVQTFPIG